MMHKAEERAVLDFFITFKNCLASSSNAQTTSIDFIPIEFAGKLVSKPNGRTLQAHARLRVILFHLGYQGLAR